MGRVRANAFLPFEHAPREPTNTRSHGVRVEGVRAGDSSEGTKKASVHFLLAKNLAKISSAWA